MKIFTHNPFPKKGGNKALLAAGLTALLTACGGSGDAVNAPPVQLEANRVEYPGLAVYGLDDQPADQVFTPWLAAVSNFRSQSAEGGGKISVRTLQYRDDRSMQDYIDFRLGQVELDTCTIEGQDGNGNSGGSSSGTPPYVSGGSQVVINSPSGPWLTLDINNELRYVDDLMPRPLPDNATLSIPGDVFPTVSSYPLYVPAAPIRLSPVVGSAPEADTQYTWQPGSDPSGHIGVDFLEFDSNGNFLGFPVYCEARDDGQFELPLDALNAVLTNENRVIVRYSRESRRIDYIDGIAFFQGMEISE